MELYDKIKESAEFIRKKTLFVPDIGMILGSGLGDIAEDIEKAAEISYADIPHFPVSTVAGHAGKMIIGKLEGKNVVALKGRIHYYEGYTMKEITFPTYLMKELGVKTLIVTNASGGANEDYRPGEFMLIDDHINFMGDNPLKGKNDERLGERFPDISNVYDKGLKKLALDTAAENDILLHNGVYVAVSGPNYESLAEVKCLRGMGADAIGMSTVPEVIVAAYLKLKVLGISCVTDVIYTSGAHGITHEEVLAVANAAKPKFIKLLKAIIRKI